MISRDGISLPVDSGNTTTDRFFGEITKIPPNTAPSPLILPSIPFSFIRSPIDLIPRQISKGFHVPSKLAKVLLPRALYSSLDSSRYNGNGKYSRWNLSTPSSASFLAVAHGATSLTTPTSFAFPNFPAFWREAKSLASSRQRTHPGRRTAKTTVLGGESNFPTSVFLSTTTCPFDIGLNRIFSILVKLNAHPEAMQSATSVMIK